MFWRTMDTIGRLRNFMTKIDPIILPVFDVFLDEINEYVCVCIRCSGVYDSFFLFSLFRTIQMEPFHHWTLMGFFRVPFSPLLNMGVRKCSLSPLNVCVVLEKLCKNIEIWIPIKFLERIYYEISPYFPIKYPCR